MNKDDFEDFKRYEEYQREKDRAMALGVGNFLYRYIMYGMIWMFGGADIGFFFANILKVGHGLSVFIGFISAFFLFKISYVKAYPFRSLVTVFFVMILLAIAVS